jgi:predicted Rdx family selenoprotein
MKQLLIFLTFSAFFFTSCQKKFSIKNDEVVLKNLIDKWEENGTKGNRLANAEFFTENGIRIQGGKTYKGKDAIRTLFSSPEEQKTYLKQENKVDRIWFSKEFITATSTRTVSYLNKATGDTITTSVEAINVFERQKDGSLKIAYSLKD